MSNARSVLEWFEHWAERTPTSPAVVCGDGVLTYGQTDQRANVLAHHLRSLGVSTNVPVGICLQRSLELPVAILAVLKAGGTFVPLDPTYPAERLSAMSRSIALGVIVTTQALWPRVSSPDARVVLLDRDANATNDGPDSRLAVSATLADPAYIAFTSGSTGQPKAPAVTHLGWSNLVSWYRSAFDIDGADRTLIISPLGFDITLRAIAMPLVSGGALHLLGSEVYDPELITRTIDDQRITLLNCAPSAFYPLVEEEMRTGGRRLRHLRHVFVGGEAMAVPRLAAWLHSEDCNARVTNVYGTAECADTSLAYTLRDVDAHLDTPVPIGSPIANTEVLILDEHCQPLPRGAIGEICIAGAGVGAGYVNDAVLTARRFVSVRHDGGSETVVYRTGDLGRIRSDGIVEFLGRMDYQVKVRGQRIELGDIESHLRRGEEVRDVVVTHHKESDGHDTLTAYVVLEHESSEDGRERCLRKLRETLAAAVPAPMVPHRFVPIASLPLTPNGKVDRNALPRPWMATAADAHSALSVTEAAVRSLFADVGGLTSVTIDDDFFASGGDSLRATEVVNGIRELFSVPLAMTAFLERPTVRAVARTVDAAVRDRRQQPHEAAGAEPTGSAIR